MPPHFGSPSDIQFINSKVGCIVGEGFGGGDSLSYNIILTTKDGGKTWQSIYLSNSFLIDTLGSMIGAANFYEYNSDILFAGGSLNNVICSCDEGRHWSRTNVIIPPGSSNSHYFDPGNGISVYFGINKTTDSGKTWKTVFKSESYAFSFTMLQFTSQQTGYAVGGVAFDATNFGIMAKTTDGGNSWHQIKYPFSDILSMYFISDKFGYASVNMDSGNLVTGYSNGSKLLKTEDGGNSWTNVTPLMVSEKKEYISNLYFINKSEGFCLISNFIYHTSDGGKTWKKDYDTPVSFLIFPDSHTGYAIDTSEKVLKCEL